MRRPTVVLGILGSQMDIGGRNRWDRWRPTVDLCRHDDLIVDRLELIHGNAHTELAEAVTADIAQVSPETRVRLHTLDFADPWAFEEVYAGLLDFVRAYPFRPDDEDYLVHITTGTHVQQICLFLLTESRYLPGRLLQTIPPARRDQGDPGGHAIIDLDLARYAPIAERFAEDARAGESFLKAGIATRNAAFNELIAQIEQVAGVTRAPILLTGPTGAGKTRLARKIFELKQHRHQIRGTFVELNCATLRGDAAMSALFGHVRGAFTGAVRDRAGVLKMADGGLLFLDEIGELGLDEQAMLLRAIEDRVFLPVGSDREVRSEFQLVAGTNRDLRADVVAGRFREDLLARIDLWSFRLPGLRERREDIEPNLDYELERWSQRHGRKASFYGQARTAFLSSPPPPTRCGRATSATSPPPSSAWPRSRPAAGSPCARSRRRSPACAPRGRARRSTPATTCSRACSAANASPRSTPSTASSWPRSYACARPPATCPTPAALCSPPRACASARATTPTA
nr:RNA repair transcriptional activator RtcR family protein [Nannocystis pusilla]